MLAYSVAHISSVDTVSDVYDIAVRVMESTPRDLPSVKDGLGIYARETIYSRRSVGDFIFCLALD